MVKLLRQFTNGEKVIAAVGDGGNDIGMMLEADIGIGISKKEDNFAAVSSDVSIRKFSHLRKLILWYGR